MNRLLLLLAGRECRSAEWLLAAGDDKTALARVANAVELLSAIEKSSSHWPGLPSLERRK